MKTLISVLLLSVCAVAQICSTPNTSINANWSLVGCNAQSAGVGNGSNINCTGESVSLCSGWYLSIYSDTQVNIGDSVTSFCDEDGTITSGTWHINVEDNALGSGTAATANSGGNTTVTKVTGPNFSAGWVGGTMMIGAQVYPISAVADSSHLTLTGNVGMNTAMVYYAGNQFTKLPQTDLNFFNQNNSTWVIGNEFYLLGSAYTVPSGYIVACEFSHTDGSIGDMDTALTVFRQPSGLPSAGLTTSTAWKPGTSSNSGSACSNGTCYLEGTTDPITIVPNGLALALQQQNTSTMQGTFSRGTLIGVDNSGFENQSSGFAGWYYTAASDTTSAGSISATLYTGNPNDNFSIAAFSLAPSGATGVCGGFTLKGGKIVGCF